jgi:hypothetical protein
MRGAEDAPELRGINDPFGKDLRGERRHIRNGAKEL